MAVMITTLDNPYDPRDDYPSWYQWDVEHGYHTCAYLDRVAQLGDDLPEVIVLRQIEQAIDEIIAIHNGGMYKKLVLDEAA